MNKKKGILLLLVVVIVSSGLLMYYQQQQRQENAYKTVEEVTGQELVSNTLNTGEPILVEKIEPTTTQKDLSKFEKEVKNKHTLYYYNSEKNIHVKLIHSEIRLEYERQEGTQYEVQTQEFLSTTGQVQRYSFSTTLSNTAQKVNAQDSINTILTESMNSEVKSIDSVSIVDNITTYELANGNTVTVNSNGIIQKIELESSSVKISIGPSEPEVPKIDSEVLEENITREE